MTSRKRFGVSEAIIGGFCIMLGGIVIHEVLTTPPIAVRAAVGPGAFPSIIAGGLLLIGARLIFRSAFRPLDLEIQALDWKAFTLGAAALLAMMLTLEWIGWILAGAGMFCAVAFAFGERRMLATLMISLIMSAGIFYLFGSLLGLSLPTGEIFDAVGIAAR